MSIGVYCTEYLLSTVLDLLALKMLSQARAKQEICADSRL